MRIKYFLLLISLLVAHSLSAKDTLIFAIDLVRHGDRTPIRALEVMPYPWKESVGQLTSTGMEQHYLLGTKLRKRYIDEEKLLPEQFITDTLYVRSTDYDRTLMSAQALLMGLYPIGTGPMQGGYQPIPIHSYPKEHDVLVANETYEKQFNELLNKHVYPSKDWQAKVVQTKAKWEHWSKYTRWNIQGLRDLVRLGNNLYVYQLYQVTPTKLSKEDLETIIALSHWGISEMYRPKEIGALLGKPSLTLINTYLSEASKHATPLKFVLLSGHDSSILSLMSALGTPLDTNPPYASHLSFALYEDNTKKQKIVMRFNDEIVSIPGCDKEGCTLAQFSKLSAT